MNLIIQIVLYSGIVQGFYSAFVLIHTKNKNPANHYLSILLVLLSFSILHSTFIIQYFHKYHQISFQIKEPFILIVIPLLWLYIKKLNEPEFHFKIKHILHFLPFVLAMLFSILSILFYHDHKENENISQNTLISNIILYLFVLVQYAFYLFYIIKLIAGFKIKAYNELSNTENIDPAWLRIYLFTFLSVFILLVAMMVIAIHNLEISGFNNIISVVFAVSIYILGYKGLFQQSIIIEKSQNTHETENYSEVKIDEQHLERLVNYMKEQKPFYNPDLTLTSLAVQLKISRNHLSEVINKGTGGNFYDFINKYRVEEVKQLLETPKFKDYTLLAIAFEAGFPSKSTFNSVFKKFTGLTPSEYKSGLK